MRITDGVHKRPWTAPPLGLSSGHHSLHGSPPKKGESSPVRFGRMLRTMPIEKSSYGYFDSYFEKPAIVRIPSGRHSVTPDLELGLLDGSLYPTNAPRCHLSSLVSLWSDSYGYYGGPQKARNAALVLDDASPPNPSGSGPWRMTKLMAQDPAFSLGLPILSLFDPVCSHPLLLYCSLVSCTSIPPYQSHSTT